MPDKPERNCFEGVSLSDATAISIGLRLRRTIQNRIKEFKFHQKIYIENEWPFDETTFRKNIRSLQNLVLQLDKYSLLQPPPLTWDAKCVPVVVWRLI